MLALTEIPAAGCRRLLRSTVFGRLALVDSSGRTELFPVNYVATDEEIWLRTGPRTSTGRPAPGPPPWVRHTDDVWCRVPWHELTGRRLGPVPDDQPWRGTSR